MDGVVAAVREGALLRSGSDQESTSAIGARSRSLLSGVAHWWRRNPGWMVTGASLAVATAFVFLVVSPSRNPAPPRLLMPTLYYNGHQVRRSTLRRSNHGDLRSLCCHKAQRTSIRHRLRWASGGRIHIRLGVFPRSLSGPTAVEVVGSSSPPTAGFSRPTK